MLPAWHTVPLLVLELLLLPDDDEPTLPDDELLLPFVPPLPPAAPVNPLPVPEVTKGHPAAVATRRLKTAIFELRMPLLRGGGSDHGRRITSSERRLLAAAEAGRVVVVGAVVGRGTVVAAVPVDVGVEVVA